MRLHLVYPAAKNMASPMHSINL